MSKCNALSPPALTRRRFLEQLGAVGGSSLVFSTLTSWDLMAGAAGQKPGLTGKPARSRVLILGGGLSGMVVGYELGKLGYDYQVLEARERVGGLQWSVRNGAELACFAGQHHELCFTGVNLLFSTDDVYVQGVYGFSHDFSERMAQYLV